ncbi:MAG: DUF2207 domain-containing protein [Minisyncoccia bacterium]
MKIFSYKNLKAFVLGFLILILGSSLLVSAASKESIDYFTTQIDTRPDGSLQIIESITYNFGSNQKHGISRNIFLTSNNGPQLDINVIGVTDSVGNPYPYTTSIANNVLTIKIGDPNFLISGTKIYVIKYNVLKAIRNFSDHQELYWNVTSNDWDVPITMSEVSISLPRSLSSPQITCYTGPYGSKQQNCTFSINNTNVKYTLTKSLGPKEGFTIVLGFPNNYFQITNITNNNSPVKTTHSFSYYLKTLTDYIRIFGGLFIFILILTLIALFILLIIKFIFKILAKAKIADDIFSPYNKPRPFIPRALRGRPVVAEYEPPAGLSPIDVGTILDQKVDPTDLSSVIISLAIRGYLKIKYLETPALFNTKTKDFEFIKLKDGTDLTHPVDKWFFLLLFNTQNQIKLSDLIGVKGIMPQTLLKIEKDEKEYLVNQGYITSHSKPTTLHIIGLSSTIILFTLSYIPLFWYKFIPIFLVPFLMLIYLMFLCYICVTYTSGYRYQLTPQGLTVLSKILGFKEFLEVTEKDRVNFFNAPELKPEKFEEYLPYAMVLGVEDKWAQKFNQIYITHPTWYESPNMNTTAFNTLLFIQDLILLASSLNTKFNFSTNFGSSSGYSSGFSSGGGFSGGGSGGGGGSSW